MSNKYAKDHVVPDGFEGTLRDFTREVLRDQPQDIPKYAYEYFLAKVRNAKAPAEAEAAADDAAAAEATEAAPAE